MDQRAVEEDSAADAVPMPSDGKRKNKKKKKKKDRRQHHVPRDADRAALFLLQASYLLAPKLRANPPLYAAPSGTHSLFAIHYPWWSMSRHLLEQMIGLGRRAGDTSLSKEMKRWICIGCGGIAVPGSTCRVRFCGNRNAHVVQTCLACGYLHRYALKPSRELRGRPARDVQKDANTTDAFIAKKRCNRKKLRNRRRRVLQRLRKVLHGDVPTELEQRVRSGAKYSHLLPKAEA